MLCCCNLLFGWPASFGQFLCVFNLNFLCLRLFRQKIVLVCEHKQEKEEKYGEAQERVGEKEEKGNKRKFKEVLPKRLAETQTDVKSGYS